MSTPVPTLEILLKDLAVEKRELDPNKDVTFKITLPEPDAKKLHAFMQSDNYERSQEIRNADIHEGTKSLEYVVNYASREFGSAATVFARFLASLYNGNRVQADVSGIRSLDGKNFEHLMKVMRLCFMGGMEPHEYFQNGNDIFENIITRHKLEKRRRS